jgi:hypothetical protein
MIGRRVCGPPLVSSCATARRCTSALLREARLAVIASDWGVTPAPRTTARLLSEVADDQGVEPAWSVTPHYLAASPGLRRLPTHAGYPKSCDHIS